MYIDANTNNYGILEIGAFLKRDSPKGILQRMWDYFMRAEETEADDDYRYTYTPQYACVLFSDIIPKRGSQSVGMRLVAFIKLHGLGEVVASPIMKNPNTRNNIQAWIWIPNAKYVKIFTQ